ncbi:MAG: hypothetical protein V1834_03695, partial [Candidatus Micrarchaeota archaeon]
VTRITALLNSLSEPGESDYRALAGYHAALLKFLVDATKTAKDNRYLFHFFKNEMGAFATGMKSLDAHAKELESALREKTGAVQARAVIAGKLSAMKNSRALQAGFEKRVKEEESGLKAEAKDGALDKEFQEAKRGEERLTAQQFKIRSRIADALNPLQRLLRKYAYAAPKKESAIAEKYAENSANALLDSADGENECKALLTQLREFKGKEDKYAQHLNFLTAFEAELPNMLREYSHLQKELAAAKEKTRVSQARKLKEKTVSDERKERLHEIERWKTRAEQERLNREKLVAEIEKEASALLGMRVKIRA